MKVQYIRNYDLFNEKNLTLALGFFDGAHLGHMKVLSKAIEVGNKTNTKTGILTFNVSVFDYINKLPILNLTSINKKIEIAKKMNFDSIYIIELTDEFIKLDRKEFLNKFLINMANIVVGFDYTFGYNRLGNIDYLKEELGNKVTVIEKLEFENEKIGTREIKEYLKNADINKANYYLDRNYEIEGYISKRNKNYSMSVSELFIPRNGEYELKLKGKDIDIHFIGKIKIKDNDNNVILKGIDVDLNNFNFIKHQIYTLEFISHKMNNDKED